ncbi:uncharacterized protein PHALS_15145 [Plasmopara halstedii]|uniref:Uncharacterized protein n=1 Tax=Plasmopara halstedii TaxID=4781 RepID=A0A0P1B2P7_PLAHL|nr:uncharacterized protein PHALS_15145 [Plasmopara halstedii]CEG48318.1 hypothetical protein PHALS_15145 [Plasmopara halstedii]|eukprot:XP_024584687.1 hypothetical protein PHALS_15145 [Plasmopara halstedii]
MYRMRGSVLLTTKSLFHPCFFWLEYTIVSQTSCLDDWSKRCQQALGISQKNGRRVACSVQCHAGKSGPRALYLIFLAAVSPGLA